MKLISCTRPALLASSCLALLVACQPQPGGGDPAPNPPASTGGRPANAGTGGSSPSPGTGGSAPSGAGGSAPAGTGGSAPAGTGGTTPAGTGGTPSTDVASPPAETGPPPTAGVDLLGKVQKSIFKITISGLVGNGTSGRVPNEMVNQKNEDVFKGEAGKEYKVTFRVRGLVEPRIYDGGMPDATASPFVQVGGMPSNTSAEHGRQYGVFKIEVSDPKQVYFLNKDHMRLKDHELYILDYKLTVPVKGGAMVTAAFVDLPGSGAIANHRNMVVPGIPEEVVKQPFKDQFIYIEADAVAAP